MISIAYVWRELWKLVPEMGRVSFLRHNEVGRKLISTRQFADSTEKGKEPGGKTGQLGLGLTNGEKMQSSQSAGSFSGSGHLPEVAGVHPRDVLFILRLRAAILGMSSSS